MSVEARTPYVKLRDGRPRFEPGPGMRRLGFKARDLRHADGRWYSAAEAMRFGLARRDEFRAKRGNWPLTRLTRTRVTDPDADGYVYFLRSGDLIKIGFSSTPLRRAATLKTALGAGVTSFAFVRGRRADERALHFALKRDRIDGEWFTATENVVQTMIRSLAAAAPMLFEVARTQALKVACSVKVPEISP